MKKNQNKNLLSEEFLKHRSKNFKELENKIKVIDFEKKERYKSVSKKKYFDEFEDYDEFENSVDSDLFFFKDYKLNQIICNAKKNEPIISFENDVKNNNFKNQKRDHVQIDMMKFRKMSDVCFHEIGINKSFLNSKIIHQIDSGNKEIEKTIDLHNFKINEAYEIFCKEILDAYKSYQRMILVITGKGYGSGKIKDEKIYQSSSEIFLDKELIRNNIVDWVNSNAQIFSISLYINFASKKHGGDGAFYIYLK